MIKELRKEKGLTQSALAQEANIPLRTIQKYESGEYKIENMTLGNAIKLASALDCEPADLIEKHNREEEQRK